MMNPPELHSPFKTHRNKMLISDQTSPEFEFWRVTDRSSTKPNNVNLVSADELFHDGILLPLHLLNLKPDPDPYPTGSDPPVALISEPESKPGPELVRETTSSKRWSGLFRKSVTKSPAKAELKREKRLGSGLGSGPGLSSTAAELRINIWPFSRSRSAGNKLTRPRISFGAPKTRKISSAPCSRSNSSGESKSRKWPSSPVRGGVHLGRSSPVWQVRRGDPTVKTKPGRVGERMTRGKMGIEDSKPKVLNLNKPVYTGYGSRLSCRNVENGSDNINNVAANNTLFGFRNIFIKKVH
ncbi:unnamed protein product [Cochlearia groenlandica]